MNTGAVFVLPCIMYQFLLITDHIFYFNLAILQLTLSTCTSPVSTNGTLELTAQVSLLGIFNIFFNYFLIKYQWKRISCKQSARWQHLSKLKASTFFSVQNKI